MQRYCELVKHASPMSRGLLVAGAMVTLAGVLSLSTASRVPYHSARTLNWHTFKVSRMSETARRGPERVSQNAARENKRADTAEVAACRPQRQTPRILQLAFQARRFRSPPVLF